MSANKFVLTHHQVEVEYTVGMPPELPALSYKDGAAVKAFKNNEITTTDTALGSLISIPLLLTIDTGGERFGFFLPEIDVAMGQTVDFKTVGVHETFGGPDSIPYSPPSWRCIELNGTAQTVIVPLQTSNA